jgi:hypothetical protein
MGLNIFFMSAIATPQLEGITFAAAYPHIRNCILALQVLTAAWNKKMPLNTNLYVQNLYVTFFFICNEIYM